MIKNAKINKEKKGLRMNKSNMYLHSKLQLNCFVGCNFNCIYCKDSFQKQMKRFKKVIDKNGNERGCNKCYNFIPHKHFERLERSYLPKTVGNEFIWLSSSSDISFMKPKDFRFLLKKVKDLDDYTFFIQTKNPKFFKQFELPAWPENLLVGITLETNKDKFLSTTYSEISKAPRPSRRYIDFKKFIAYMKSGERKNQFILTLEPILEFDKEILIEWVSSLDLNRIYVGYESNDNISIPTPDIRKTFDLVKELRKITKVFLKYIPKNNYKKITSF